MGRDGREGVPFAQGAGNGQLTLPGEPIKDQGGNNDPSACFGEADVLARGRRGRAGRGRPDLIAMVSAGRSLTAMPPPLRGRGAADAPRVLLSRNLSYSARPAGCQPAARAMSPEASMCWAAIRLGACRPSGRFPDRGGGFAIVVAFRPV